MRLGDLLLQEGAIDQEHLDKALDHQKENPKIRVGEALVTLGFLDMKTLVATLAKQNPPPGVASTPLPGGGAPEEASEPSKAMLLGQILLKEKVVTPEQLKKTVEYQQQHPNKELGKALIEFGLTTEQTIADALQRHASGQESPAAPSPPPDSSEPGKPTKIGEILVNDNVITEEQLQKALEYQKQYQGTPLGKAIIDLGLASDKTIGEALKKQRRAG